MAAKTWDKPGHNRVPGCVPYTRRSQVRCAMQLRLQTLIDNEQQIDQTIFCIGRNFFGRPVYRNMRQHSLLTSHLTQQEAKPVASRRVMKIQSSDMALSS
jgi:hypothetical protein